MIWDNALIISGPAQVETAYLHLVGGICKRRIERKFNYGIEVYGVVFWIHLPTK